MIEKIGIIVTLSGMIEKVKELDIDYKEEILSSLISAHEDLLDTMTDEEMEQMESFENYIEEITKTMEEDEKPILH